MTKIYAAAKVLSAMCDGARSRDGVGYNKYDSRKVEEILLEDKNAKSEKYLFNILKKYHRQLKELGAIENNVDELEFEYYDPEREDDMKKFDVVLKKSGNSIIVDFEYDKKLVEIIKSMPTRKYHSNQKVWTIPASEDDVKLLLSKLSDYKVSPKFKLSSLSDNLRTITVDGGKIIVKFPYNKNIVDAIKELPERSWNNEETQWEIPINKSNCLNVIEFGREYNFDISGEVREVCKERAKSVEKSKATDANIDVENIGNDELQLKPFQRAGVKYCVEKQRAIIADEVGLGKTVQSLATVEELNAYPALIICPSHLKINWKKEVKKWIMKDLDVTIIDGLKNEDFGKHDVYIINYDILDCSGSVMKKYNIKHANKDLLKNIDFESVIIDESHKLKNHKSQRSKAAEEIINDIDIPTRLLLSATPMPNRPKELIHQLNLLGKLNELGGFWKFAKRYCNAYRGQFGLEMDGAANTKELHQRLRESCFIRRKKKQILEELPPVNRNSIPVEIDNRDEYNEVRDNIVEWLKENEGKEKADKALKAKAMVKLSKLRKVVAKGKKKSAIKWIENFLESGEKLITFAHHVEVTHEIADHFGCLKIVGGMSKSEKNDAVEKFQNGDEQLIVISLQAGSVGLTLTEASNIAFLELGWTPTTHDQAEGRAYGRLNDVHGINSWYIIADNTIDERMLSTINRKREVIDNIVDGEHRPDDNIKAEVVDEVIKDLLQKSS